MSRIEDALRKLEQERRSPGASRVTESRPTATGTGAHAPLRPFTLGATTHHLTFDATVLRRWGPVAILGDDERPKREYGQIKRPIINLALGRAADAAAAGNVVLVTSALASEGKSLTTFNLAASMAREKDLSVILVDADLLKPDISRTLGLGEANGLADLLADEALQLDDVLWKTSVDRFFFIPAGRRRGGATELLGSQRMRQVIGMFARDLPRTIVIIDSSPLLLTNEAPTLAALAGQTVLVVRANATARLAVADALARLEPGKPVGLVLNGADADAASYYSGGGAYGGDPSESDTAATRPPATTEVGVPTGPQ